MTSKFLPSRTLLATLAVVVVVVGSVIGSLHGEWFGQAGAPNRVTGAVIASPFGSGEAGFHIESTSLTSLIHGSDTIVQARFESETNGTIDISVGDRPAVRHDLTRHFTIERALSQTPLRPGANIDVVFTVGITAASGSLSSTPALPMKAGHSYVLFLRSVRDVGGVTIIGLANDPGAAEVTSTGLTFIVSPDLANAHESEGKPALPTDFQNVTLDRVAQTIAAKAATP